ncbi:hypothetical protein KP509_09G032600 [Ceratopteris richardii]|uniref:Pentatricopeptide repeat-containing protein n=2 Tax=Ceratopteris richardii TaxID=49495 RepID=A0A8T2U1K1_CERRI|nr:hypothetical protein KP509_09G032600 [Ceratopteris richardii]
MIVSPRTGHGSLGSLKWLCRQKKAHDAVQVILALQHQGKEVSADLFYHVLQCSIDQRDLISGRTVYCLIVRASLEANTFLGSHIIRMFASCGSLYEADNVFRRLPKHNLHTWSAAIAAHTRYGRAANAFGLYRQLQSLCLRPDEYIFASILKVCTKLRNLHYGQIVHIDLIEESYEWDSGVCNALIDLYMKCGSLKDAHVVFESMSQPDTVTMTALISGYRQHGCMEDVLDVFHKMLVKGLIFDAFILSSLLKACSDGLLFIQGKLLHALAIEQDFDKDTILRSSLIYMYAKCGDVSDACRVFSIMPGANLSLWNSLTSGFALQGEQGLVVNYVEELRRRELKPDALGFACLLSACSKMGLVGEGCSLFQWMQKKHGIIPTVEHFTCIADLLSRAGFLTRAQDLLQSMPSSCDTVGWSAVLSNCRTFGDATDVTLISDLSKSSQLLDP